MNVKYIINNPLKVKVCTQFMQQTMPALAGQFKDVLLKQNNKSHIKKGIMFMHHFYVSKTKYDNFYQKFPF